MGPSHNDIDPVWSEMTRYSIGTSQLDGLAQGNWEDGS